MWPAFTSVWLMGQGHKVTHLPAPVLAGLLPAHALTPHLAQSLPSDTFWFPQAGRAPVLSIA